MIIMKKALSCFAVCMALACVPAAAYAQTQDDAAASNDPIVATEDGCEATVLAANQSTTGAVVGEEYSSLQEALEAAQDGDTIVLMGDCIVSEPLVITANITIDLNGYSIYNEQAIYNEEANSYSLISVQGVSLTIKGDGTVQALESDCYAIDVRDGGSCTINGGTYVGNSSAVYVFDGS